MQKFLTSNIQIRNIAVCMYGQYRTGDACLKYIKDFYSLGSDSNVNVDFFCSLKPYETTYTRHIHNEATNKDYMQQDQLSESAVDHQRKQIYKYYNPKKFKVFEKEYEDQLKHIDATIMHSKVLSAWTEAVMLKQEYEAENNMSYDLVIMQRYDVILWPTWSFRAILHKMNGISVAERMSLATAEKNILMFQPIDFLRPANLCLFYPNGQDLWVWGFGNALDVFVYDALEHIPSKHTSNFDKKKYNTGYPHIDTHEMLGSIARKMNLPTSMFPYLEVGTREAILPLEIMPLRKNKLASIAPMPIRDVYWDDGVIPELDKLTDAELEKMFVEQIQPRWLRGD